MRNALLLLSLALVSCATPRPEPPDSGSAARSAAAGEERVVGTVRVVGSAPVNVRVVLQPREGKSIALAGPLQEELRQLAGAEVEVTGAAEPSPDPMTDRQIRATDYRILSVDGEPVITGTVEGRVDGWTILRTPEGETVYLAGAPPQIEPGQKVWVQGPRSVVVQSYGIVKK